MRIQHNIMAMNAYRNYTNNVSAMKANLEKLSSGYKINRAGDDAAGLAISEKMRAQITGLETAQKNAKDGISLVQTAEGALTEVHDMLNRMVELATQSANGTYDNTTDRAQLQKEMDQLKTEINRIADSSNFNGIKLLDGSMEEESQVKVSLTGKNDLSIVTDAAKVQGTNTIKHKDVAEASKTTFELEMSNVTYTATSTANNTISITIGAKTFTVTATAEGLSGNKLAQAIYDKMMEDSTIAGDEDKMETEGLAFQTGVNYSVKVDGDKLVFEMTDKSLTNSTAAASFQAPVTVQFSAGTGVAASADNYTDWKISNVKVGTAAGGSVLADTVVDSTKVDLSDIDWYTDGKGIRVGDETYVIALTSKTANTDFGEGYKVIDLTDICTEGAADKGKLSGTGGTDPMWVKTALSRITEAAADNKMFSVQLASDSNLSFREKIDYNGNGEDGRADLTTFKGIQKQIQFFDKVSAETVSVGKGKKLTLQIGDTADDYNQLKVNIKDMHASAMGIDGISIADQDSAAKAIEAIKSAINYVSDVRGTLGATQNRLDHTINNLSVMTENIQDAESTIRDTDVAAEMMAYTKNNILIQSAQAMLAQANQVPQGVLQLLQ